MKKIYLFMENLPISYRKRQTFVNINSNLIQRYFLIGVDKYETL